MKTTGTPPSWATELIERVCRDHGRRPAKVKTWRNSRHWYSSGHCSFDGTLSITAGYDPVDARLVVLHEVGHYLTITRGGRGRRGNWHGKRFWTKAWELYAIYGVPLGYALWRDGNYCGGDRWCPSLILRAVDHPLAPRQTR